MEIQVKNLKKVGTKKLKIDGKTDIYETYYVPIQYLWFNDKNGRISSFILEHEQTQGNQPLKQLRIKDCEKYNDLIAQKIIDSANDNGKSFKKTKMSIRKDGQREPGVVLTDGRVIDGNRRFTAIRELHKEFGEPDFFEAAVIQAPKGDDDEVGWKKIKALEYNLQHNVDEKRQYDKIDFLVDFYNTIVVKKLFSKKEYILHTGIKESTFDQYLSYVEAMNDYLNWRTGGKQNQFHLLKKDKLDGPIEEVGKLFKSKSITEADWNKMKDTIYTYMTVSNQGSRTQDLRQLLNSAKDGGVLYLKIDDLVHNQKNFKLFNSYIDIKDKQLDPQKSMDRQILSEECSNLMSRIYKQGIIEENESGQEELETITKISNKLTVLCESCPFGIKNNQWKTEFLKKITEIERVISNIKSKVN